MRNLLIALLLLVGLCAAQSDTILQSCNTSAGTCRTFEIGDAWTPLTGSSSVALATDYAGGSSSLQNYYGSIWYYDNSMSLSSTNPAEIYDFNGSGNGFLQPLSNLVADGNGNYYGSYTATANNGKCPSGDTGGGFYKLSGVSSTGATGTLLACNIQPGGNYGFPQGQIVYQSCKGFSNSDSNHKCLYSTTPYGGLNTGMGCGGFNEPGCGALVAVDTTNGNVFDLYDFSNSSSSSAPGCSPLGGLTDGTAASDPDVILWGTASACGQNSGGTLFRVALGSSSVTFTAEHEFASADGTDPQGPVLRAIIGSTEYIFGTSWANGNSNACGSFWDYTGTTFTSLYPFNGRLNNDGCNPAGGCSSKPRALTSWWRA